MRTWIWAGFTILGALASAGAAEFGARIDYWKSDLSGDVKVENESIPATKLTHSELGMDTTEGIPVGEVFLRFGKALEHRVSLRYFEHSYDGQSTLTRSVTFSNLTFPVTTPLSSRIAFKDLDLRYAGDFWQEAGNRSGPRRANAIWGIAGIKSLDLRIELSAPGVGSVKESQTAPLPVLGLGGRWGRGGHFSLEAEVAGLALDISDIRASFFEATAGARWDFTPNVALSAGWRTWHLGATFDSTTKVDVSATLQGPYAGLEWRF